MGTMLFPRVIRDWFLGLRSDPARSETERAAERATTPASEATAGEAPDSEEILRRAAENNDGKRRD
jgi:hypothetical protein